MDKWNPKLGAGFDYQQRFQEGAKIARETITRMRDEGFPGIIAKVISQFGKNPAWQDAEQGFLWELGLRLITAVPFTQNVLDRPGLINSD